MEKRNYSIDIIKIIAMFFVVVLHMVGVSGGINEASGQNTVLQMIFCGTESLSFVCVNLFALVTGFLCANKRIRLAKITELWLQAIFISLLTFVAVLIIKKDFDVVVLLKSNFNIYFESYWYLNEYIVLAFLSPFLNYIIHSLKDKQLFLLIIVFAVFLVVLPTIAAKERMRMGYSFVWLSYLYIIGAYIRKNNLHKRISKRILALVWVMSFVGEAGLIFCSRRYSLTIMNIINFNKVYLWYNNIFIFICSVSFFMLLLKINIKSEKTGKVLANVSNVVFNVYLVQCSPAAWKYLREYSEYIGRLQTVNALVTFWVTVFIVFAVCIGIGFFQSWMFKLLKIRKFSEKTEDFLKSKYDELYNFIACKMY